MTPPSFDVVGIGENSVDYVYRVPATPTANEKLPASAHRVFCGGQVVTTLCTCAAYGLRTAYVGAFGDDENGARIRDALTARGVDISLAPVRPAPNREAVILVNERNGDRTIVWQRDPRLALTTADLPHDAIASARLLHVDDLDVDTAVAAAEIATMARVPVTTDIDHVTERTARLVSVASFPIFSSHVPAALTGEADPEKALRKLREGHPGWLCVTLGAAGAMLLEGDRLHHVPAVEVEAVDTTGAGDVFRGAFIYALLRGRSPVEILRFAVAAASLSCTREGALDSVPALEDVERLLT